MLREERGEGAGADPVEGDVYYGDDAAEEFEDCLELGEDVALGDCEGYGGFLNGGVGVVIERYGAGTGRVVEHGVAGEIPYERRTQCRG